MESLRIVEVGRPGTESPPVAANGEEARYRVEIGDAVIEVGDGFREETLCRPLSVVRAC